jgi:hypothetical protein
MRGVDECSSTYSSTITTVIPNAFVLRTQAMNITINHTTIHVNY